MKSPPISHSDAQIARRAQSCAMRHVRSRRRWRTRIIMMANRLWKESSYEKRGFLAHVHSGDCAVVGPHIRSIPYDAI
jgi:hypothetical protein